MKRILRGIAVTAMSTLLVGTALAADYTVETFTSGVLDSEPPVKNALIRSDAELGKTKESLGITSALPQADFGKESLLLIVPSGDRGGIIDITGVVPAPGAIDVRYRVISEGPQLEPLPRPSYPYLIARLRPAPGGGVRVRFIDQDYASSLASGTGLGQFGDYTHVLTDGRNAAFSEFLPLDRGNSWTYATGPGGDAAEVTYSVVSESDGWSVFDSFFGAEGVGMKITPGGEVVVSSGGGIKPFYTPDVETEVRKGPVSTPAGEFGEVLVVTIPEGGDFWFRDVYARGVGLISHERNSRKGRFEYTLVRAVVGGKEYPRREARP